MGYVWQSPPFRRALAVSSTVPDSRYRESDHKNEYINRGIDKRCGS